MGFLLSVAAGLLVLDACGSEDVCSNPPVPIGGIVKAQAASGRCTSESELYQLKRYDVRRGSGSTVLRCGRVGTNVDVGYGYLHILAEKHGDPMDHPTFDAEIQTTLLKGKERDAADGKWRYSIQYDDVKSACFKGKWGFRVIVAWVPLRSDGMSSGIITAYYLDQKPREWP